MVSLGTLACLHVLSCVRVCVFKSLKRTASFKCLNFPLIRSPASQGLAILLYSSVEAFVLGLCGFEVPVQLSLGVIL